MEESTSDSATMTGWKDSYIYNRVNYRDYTYSCLEGTTTERRPDSMFALLTDNGYAGHPAWTTCQSYSPGLFTRNAGTNDTYAAGVNVGPISVSAQAGWSSDVSLAWYLHAPSRYCGSTPKGPVASPRAEMSHG